ncbi:DNA-binding transcriptional LysR family regulator [Litoreibacter meonggei]|uniref:DNA-binding transcriptional LysR family regulator n=1 Tax=Litoreibacter meonggei TaxID=1049199 RepID=A0A497WSB5_9RHOB|nr:LysR substrate-binding domain-containing protein [Litoreibacter meonggei]RLJ52134.1 DNA-binding transcriptional LysR family regulator [Litoreibacter meonggei]
MDLKFLDDVLVLLEEGNMTRAASRRNITQPAFSRRIRAFENWLGVEVLERGANSVEISQALKANEPEMRALVSRIADLRGKIAQFNPASSTISIAAQHAPFISTLPDMIVHAKHHLPALKFRLRTGNLRDCVTLFLRGDVNTLLCYESENTGPLPFGDTIRREPWGVDYLIPVIGGSRRYTVKDHGKIPHDTPSVVYPEGSYFGEFLNSAERMFGTSAFSNNPVCESAFSSGVKELVLNGIGVGWIPYSMAHREIENGSLISLANSLGKECLKVTIYTNKDDEISNTLLDVWGAIQH